MTIHCLPELFHTKMNRLLTSGVLLGGNQSLQAMLLGKSSYDSTSMMNFEGISDALHPKR